ncbi:hypothetical protein [Iningainema tapete]|uniref:Uncharacterized protein n=1 Tax=Iningainema tapete BLCC-T55 TaxID=2748662 RepID=A0A8J7C675_9CYAN|nr:hypothetical protein [Iningainema tapete]MBD2773969.1 hypothetical protein [Iningainema tapete BLCC-T55]
MEDKEINPILDEVNVEESANVNGGVTTANFDISGYSFVIGGGVVFGVPADEARDLAFQQALFVSSTAPGGGNQYTP